MNHSISILVLPFLIVVTLITACNTQHQAAPVAKQTMLLDQAAVSDTKVTTVVRGKKPMRPIESMGDVKDNPNIAQTDLDALERHATKEIRLIDKGEKLRLYETNTVSR